MPRSAVRRLIWLSALVVGIWFLSNTLEIRKTAYSCRTVWSCFGLGTRHSYAYPLPAVNPEETGRTLQDGTARFDRRLPHAKPEVLVVVLSKDAASWSSDFRSTQRSAYDFVDLLVSTGLNLTTVSFAMLTASTEEYGSMKSASARYPFGRVTLLHREDAETGTQYQNRHDPAVQLARRSALAILRNRLMSSALEDEKHVLWLDADVVDLSKGIVQTMLRHSDENGDAGIITALCHQNRMNNYDKNAWRLGDDSSLLGAIPNDQREQTYSKLVDTRLMLPDVVQGTDDAALIPIDSVGGTLLYVRGDLVRQGLVFPHFNVVGTMWSQAGWVGVETEGLCYMARGLKGGGCYALGGKHHARHTDWG
ncbi:glycosyltransferase family 62 protein [Teratosphaeria destructans]|uniref:Glycosyltransferase family 62 protein n=1 Tax=Teratosphaeria destructans TaxID=418781 RepID=A0A9W7SKZ7_9PEZI|nr:glycosyltransferase family 62 protein [Teratosphaeria destructans]